MRGTYEVCEMDMAVCIQQYVVGLHVSMHNAHAVDVSQRAPQLSDPKSNSLFHE
jgi:hypothetical protein